MDGWLYIDECWQRGSGPAAENTRSEKKQTKSVFSVALLCKDEYVNMARFERRAALNT